MASAIPPRDSRVCAQAQPPPPPGGEKWRAWICAHLTVPAVCDTLDSLGWPNQAMHQRLRPLDPERCVFAGRARTFKWNVMRERREHDPYALEIEAMDSLRPGDVVVHSTDRELKNAPWGDLMSTAACRRGVVGCVCDSLIRDCRRIRELGFPVFHVGVRPLDSNGRCEVVAYDVAVECGEVTVSGGDLIFADVDGVVVVPRKLESRVLPLARERVDRESSARRALKSGSSLREVFDKHRVL